MSITDSFVLPADVRLVPVAELPAEVRARISCAEGDYAIARSRSRSPSRIIDMRAAELLEHFRASTTIVGAVIAYSRAANTDPEATLVDAFPLLQRLIESRLLVPANSPQASGVDALFEAGDRVGRFEVLACIRLLEDTELYQARGGSGELAALKILRSGSRDEMQRLLDREAVILRHLDGRVNPGLLEAGIVDGRPYLAIEWCEGVDVATAAEELRQHGGADGRRKLLELCRAILDAYAHLHAQRVIHSDVHPSNVLVGADGAVKIVDYGLARLPGAGAPGDEPPRAGTSFLSEPEYATARRAGVSPPRSSLPGEQYALGAMLYFLLTGTQYLEFSLDESEVLRQIAEDNPLPFSRRGIEPWPDVERLLVVALSKNPWERLSSVAEFAKRLGSVGTPEERDNSAPASDLAASNPSAAGGRMLASQSPARALLNAVLARLGLSGPLLPAGLATAPSCSLWMGASGIAYALYRIAIVREDAALLSLADIWSAKAMKGIGTKTAFYSAELEITPQTVGEISLYHTASGVHCARALIAHAMGDLMAQREAVETFIAASRGPCHDLDLTLGRSGTILGCTLLLDAMPCAPSQSVESLIQFGNEVMRGIWAEIDSLARIQQSAQLRYSGMAHGWAGVLYATMRWCQAARSAMPAMVEERLHQLAECAEYTGRGARWRPEIARPSRNRVDSHMPGWCHGSAGFVHLWTLAHSIFGEPTHLELAEKAAWNAWEDPGAVGDLCCGLGGRAYSLLNLYKHTSEPDWSRRARSLADGAAVAIGDSSLGVDSLYKGKVGLALLTADLERPETACMPMFEHEGWPTRR